jgi:tetratricopeptide (TPR) repeat protein
VPEPGAHVEKEKDLPKRSPKASTCVAFGNYHLEAAAEPATQPAQREQMYEYARKAYLQAIALDSQCLEAYLGLARTYERLDDYDRAFAAYRQGIKAMPKDATLPYELGLCQARHRELEPALASLKTAADLEPDNRKYMQAYAYALARVGRYDESFAAFRSVVGEARAHYNLARMLQHNHQELACRQHLQQALQADPDLAPARALLVELNTAGKPVPASVSLSIESNDPSATLVPSSR